MACEIATIHAALKENGAAFTWLAKAFRQQSAWWTHLKIDPRLINLRGDARFEEFLKDAGVSNSKMTPSIRSRSANGNPINTKPERIQSMNQPISTRGRFHVLLYIGIGILAVVAGLLAFIATRPEDFRIERSAQINAPADVVFALIDDLHQWQRWSPYEKLDPDMKKTFDGPDSGPGAGFAWNGNNQAGEGRLTIVASKPCELVTMDLKFTRPFACNNQVNFKLAPSEAGTRVSWIMDGKNNFIGKAFSTFMNMDKMVGAQFEEGLANLDAMAQAESRKGNSTAQDPAAQDAPAKR